MVKREIKRQLRRYGKFLEPFALLLLLSVFILPILSVINLSPRYSGAKVLPESVLGVSTSEKSKLQLIGGNHNYIINERIIAQSASRYIYSSTLLAREANNYGKPIVQVSNPSSKDVELRIFLLDPLTQSAQFSIYAGESKLIREANGLTSEALFTVAPNSSVDIFLEINSGAKINYSEKISIAIWIRGEDVIEIVPIQEGSPLQYDSEISPNLEYESQSSEKKESADDQEAIQNAPSETESVEDQALNDDATDDWRKPINQRP